MTPATKMPANHYTTPVKQIRAVSTLVRLTFAPRMTGAPSTTVKEKILIARHQTFFTACL
jgi:hypothetical protein